MNRPSPAPPPLHWPRKIPADLTPLRDEELRLTAEAHRVWQEVRAAEDAGHAAPELDRRAYAHALRNNLPQPEVTEAQKAAEALAVAQKAVEGVSEAQWQVRDEITSTLERVRAQWAADLAAQTAQARTDYTAAVQALIAARDNVARCFAEEAWLDRFPHKPSILVFTPPVQGLLGRNGQSVNWPAVAGALLAEAEVLFLPEPPPPPYDVEADLALMRDSKDDGAYIGGDRFTIGLA